jgi:predicted ester cyclase
MSVDRNKDVARRLFEEAFNRGNLDVLGELVDPRLVYHSPDGDIRGLEGARQLVVGMRAAFPDFHVTAEDVLAEEDKVVIRFTDSGTYQGDEFGDGATTGKWVTWTGVDIFRIADGKIIEGWGTGDMLGLMRQLGVLPPADGPSQSSPLPNSKGQSLQF